VGQYDLFRKPAKQGMKVKGKVIDSAQAEKYNNFYERAFSEQEIEDMLNEGAGVSYQNFKVVANERMERREFYDVMFENTWRSKRDGVVRSSKFHNLGEAIYELFPKETRVEFKTIKYKSVSVERLRVKGGEKIKYQNKSYRGGQFLPKGFYYKK
jgi:hypothetical protein